MILRLSSNTCRPKEKEVRLGIGTLKKLSIWKKVRIKRHMTIYKIKELGGEERELKRMTLSWNQSSDNEEDCILELRDSITI